MRSINKMILKLIIAKWAAITSVVKILRNTFSLSVTYLSFLIGAAAQFPSLQMMKRQGFMDSCPLTLQDECEGRITLLFFHHPEALF